MPETDNDQQSAIQFSVEELFAAYGAKCFEVDKLRSQLAHLGRQITELTATAAADKTPEAEAPKQDK